VKEGLKVKNKLLEHHHAVDFLQKDTPGWWATVWRTPINFKLQIIILKQHQSFKISYFHKFYLSVEKYYLSSNIPKNHQKSYKTAQNV